MTSRDGDPAVFEAARRVRANAAEHLAAGYVNALPLDDNLQEEQTSYSTILREARLEQAITRSRSTR